MLKELDEFKIENGDYSVVDNETGIVIDVINKGDKITRKGQSEHCKEYITNFNKGESFVKIFDKTLPILSKKLSNPEFVLTMQLLPYISYKDNILRHNGKIIYTKELSKLLDMDYNYVRNIITSLIQKGVICSTKTGCLDKPKISVKTLVCNPYIFVKGTEVNRVIAGLFENNGWNII